MQREGDHIINQEESSNSIKKLTLQELANLAAECYSHILDIYLPLTFPYTACILLKTLHRALYKQHKD